MTDIIESARQAAHVPCEVVGSVIALVAMVGVYAYGLSTDAYSPTPVFLAVGLPAMFHLVAVVLHRFVLDRPQT